MKQMKLKYLLLLLVSGVAFAQGSAGQPGSRVARGNFLRIPAYNTSGVAADTYSYFVDGSLGNDANTCTASGASACLTIQGAINKIPKLLKNGVSVDIASGSYAGFYITGFAQDVGFQQTTAGLLIRGAALANSTLATGTATGTATAGSAGSGATFGTMTDSGQAWTVNNLRGRFLTITGGTGSGQTYPISSNTATAITIVGVWGTAPVSGSTYAVQDVATTITSGVVLPPSASAASVALGAGVLIANNNLNVRDGTVSLQRLGTSGAGIRSVFISDSTNLNVTNCQWVGTGIGIQIGGSVNGALGAPFVTTNSVVFNNTNSQGIATNFFGGVLITNNTLFNANSYGVFSFGGSIPSLRILQTEILNVSNLGIATPSGNLTLSGSRISCNGVSTAAIGMSGSINPAAPPAPMIASISTSNVDSSCALGVQAVGAGTNFAISTLAGSTSTTALDARLGALIQYTSATTITGTTQDINVEAGGVTAALGDITAGQCAASLTYGSRVCKQ